MKIIFLGTGAADWDFSQKDTSSEFRRFSSALVNDDLLIDPGPHVFDAFEAFNKDPKKIKYVIVTHRHSDHFNAQTLEKLESLGAKLFEFAVGEEKVIDNYSISAYSANHSTCNDPLHYIISDGIKTLFYGLDGAWLMYDEVQGIISKKPDLAVLDATIGFIDGDYRIFEHNNLNMVLEMKKTLGKYVKKFCISHMARTLHTDHKTLSEKMSEYDVLTAFDGMEIEI